MAKGTGDFAHQQVMRQMIPQTKTTAANRGSAPEDGVYKALLPLFEQTDSAVLKHLYFFFHVLLQLLCLHLVCFLRGRPPAS